MLLDIGSIQTMTFEEIYLKLEPMISLIKKEYSYAGLSNAIFNKCVMNGIKQAYIHFFEKLPTNPDLLFESSIRNNLNHTIKLSFSNKNHLVEVFKSYCEKNIVASIDSNHLLNELLKISTFFNNYNCFPNSEVLIEIINTNDVVNNLLSRFVKSYSKVIQDNKLESIVNDDFLLDFIELYCLSNDVIKYDTDLEDNSLLNDSSYIEDSTNAYLKEIMLPLLTKEEEKVLLNRLANGDTDARKILIERNLRLVVYVAKKFRGKGLPFLDLIQEGNIGLVKAIDNFDLSKNVRLSTYAVFWVRQYIRKAIFDKSRMIRIPIHQFEQYNNYDKVLKQLENEKGRKVTEKELAKELDVSLERVRQYYMDRENVISINELAFSEDDNDSEIGDMIPLSDKDLQDVVINNVLFDDLNELFDKCNLNSREKQILTYYYGLGGCPILNEKELGKMFNVTNRRISQIQISALEKIRKSKYISDFAVYMQDIEKAKERVIYNGEKDRYVYRHINNKVANEKSFVIKRDGKSIYSYFFEYPEEQVTEVLKSLSDRDLDILHERYGEDFLNPVYNKRMSMIDKNFIYADIFPKMKRILENKNW